MAKNITYIIALCALLYSCGGRVSDDTLNTRLPPIFSGGESEVVEDVQEDVQAAVPSGATVVDAPVVRPITIQDIYLSQLHVREATGNNDGPDVEKYLRSTGFGPGYAWCSAFVHWSLEEAKIPNRVTAWSPTAENSKNIVFKLREFKKEPKPGDVITFYYSNLGRIGHAGFYNKRISDVTYESVEGNTNGAGSREGNGVYKKYRAFNATNSISRWAKD